MPEVFAGWMVGFALSTLIAPVAAWQLISSNEGGGFAQRFAPPGTNVVALTVVLHMLGLLLLTALGMLLGLVLRAIEERQPDGGLGSPNMLFTIIVIALAAVVVIPTTLFPSVRAYTLSFALLAAIGFGWAMPWLSTLG